MEAPQHRQGHLGHLRVHINRAGRGGYLGKKAVREKKCQQDGNNHAAASYAYVIPSYVPVLRCTSNSHVQVYYWLHAPVPQTPFVRSSSCSVGDSCGIPFHTRTWSARTARPTRLAAKCTGESQVGGAWCSAVDSRQRLVQAVPESGRGERHSRKWSTFSARSALATWTTRPAWPVGSPRTTPAAGTAQATDTTWASGSSRCAWSAGQKALRACWLSGVWAALARATWPARPHRPPRAPWLPRWLHPHSRVRFRLRLGVSAREAGPADKAAALADKLHAVPMAAAPYRARHGWL